jgi:hypothetical protein
MRQKIWDLNAYMSIRGQARHLPPTHRDFGKKSTFKEE